MSERFIFMWSWMEGSKSYHYAVIDTSVANARMEAEADTPNRIHVFEPDLVVGIRPDMSDEQAMERFKHAVRESGLPKLKMSDNYTDLKEQEKEN